MPPTHCTGQEWAKIGSTSGIFTKAKQARDQFFAYSGTAHLLLINFGMRQTNHFLFLLAGISPYLALEADAATQS